ncbi:hypothetical protein OG535_00360 [Kitasatospora sp. NBC_00085]|uniref:hypothetical protein n=1 Tax=Kitasatospora sp. NBC_00085 TaxID=2903566 RepID=UPI003245137E
MRGPGYHLVTDLLVAAGHTREQASAAVARIESDVLDWAQGTVGSTGLRCPDDRDDCIDGRYEGTVAANTRLAEHAERARVEARRGGIAVSPGSTPSDTDPDGWPGPTYVLVRQPESLMLGELLTHRFVALTGALEGTPPEIYLDDMATAWPFRS